MTDEEKQWLSQFIEETEHGNVNKTNRIKAEVKSRKVLKSQYVAARKTGNVDEMLRLEQAMSERTAHIEALRDASNNFYTTDTEAQAIYDRDNERRRDVYNNAKITDNLVLYDLTEYDKFTTESISHIDPENLMMDHLHWVPQKKKKK